MGHRGHVHPVGDQDVEDGVDGEATGDLDGHRPHPGDLAELAGLHVAAHQGAVVDPDVDGGPGAGARGGRSVRPGGGGGRRPVAGQRDEGVGGEGPARFVDPGGPGPGGQARRFVGDRGEQPGTLVGGQPGVEAHGAVPLDPVAQVAAPPHLLVGGPLVLPGRPHPPAPQLQHVEGLLAGGVDQ